MPIINTDLKHYLSGGAANANPAVSIGGAKSSVQSGANIFDDVPSADYAAGYIDYRLVYMQNGHATLTALGAKAYVDTQTPSANTVVDIGLAAAGKNAVETATANRTTAPAGVSFSAAASFAAGLALGDLAPGDYYGVWERRAVTAGSGYEADSFVLALQCDTSP